MGGELVFGRPESDWYVLADECLEFLMERARYGVLTTYAELNAVLARRTGLPAFDLRQDIDTVALGYLLDLVADRTFAESGLLISVLCFHHVDEKGPGRGFFGLASDDEHRLLSKMATATERMDFWADHVRKVQEYYG